MCVMNYVAYFILKFLFPLQLNLSLTFLQNQKSPIKNPRSATEICVRSLDELMKVEQVCTKCCLTVSFNASQLSVCAKG